MIDEQHFERLIAHIQDVVYSVDAKTKEFSYISPAFERIFGYSLNDIRVMGGREAFLKHVIQEGRFVEQDRMLEDLKSGKKQQRHRHVAWWRCKDGTLKCIEDHWVEVYDDNRLVSTDGVLRDISEQKRLEKEQERLIGELQEALTKIKTLRGLIPICASCKKIRDDDGYWRQVETFIHDHSEATFSHGLCPECAEKVLTDHDQTKAGK